MSKVVCFGEIMGRLCPPGYKKVLQATSFDVTFAGGEANVAVSLANYGMDASFVSKLPKNDLGKLVKRILKSYDVAVDQTTMTREICMRERFGETFADISQKMSK